MSSESIAKLGELKLSDGRDIIITRLPLGGFEEVRDAATASKDELIKVMDSVTAQDPQDISHMRMGMTILQAIPDVLRVYLRWTVSEAGEIPSTDEFIRSIAVADVPKILEIGSQDIIDIAESLKNAWKPLIQRFQGLTG